MEQNSGFSKQEFLLDKLSELAQNVKHIKDVLTTLLLTNQIYHLHKFLPILVLWLCQRIMQAPYVLVTYTQVVELTKHDFFMLVSLTGGMCLELVPSCVRVCVYGLAICCGWAKRQGWPGSSLCTPLRPQVGWQANLMTLDGTQTLVASRMTELDSCGASERDLVLLGNSGKLDLEKDRDDGGIALEKGDDQTVGEQWSAIVQFYCLY